MAATETRTRDDAHVRAETAESVSVRCNAPQRTPRFPRTPWGQLRATKGWSLRELAKRTGVNQGVLSRIERSSDGAKPAQATALLRAYADPRVHLTYRRVAGVRPMVTTWRDLREDAGLTMPEVERLTGINRAHLSRFENGCGPSPDHAVALLVLYGLAVPGEVRS